MILGIIPARGGSKGVYKKNIRECDGIPLICHTFDEATKSRLIDRIILSTDSSEIAELGKSYGIEVPFLRPEELAGDDSPIIDTIRHALKFYEHFDINAIVLLQPTSPLRTSFHIDDSIWMMYEHKVESVVSVVRVPHNFSCNIFRMGDDNTLNPINEDDNLISDRHKKPVLYARNGPAILVSKVEVIERGDLYGHTVMGYEMSVNDSIDIDSMLDFRIAEMLLKERKYGNQI